MDSYASSLKLIPKEIRSFFLMFSCINDKPSSGVIRPAANDFMIINGLGVYFIKLILSSTVSFPSNQRYTNPLRLNENK